MFERNVSPVLVTALSKTPGFFEMMSFPPLKLVNKYTQKALTIAEWPIIYYPFKQIHVALGVHGLQR